MNEYTYTLEEVDAEIKKIEDSLPFDPTERDVGPKYWALKKHRQGLINRRNDLEYTEEQYQEFRTICNGLDCNNKMFKIRSHMNLIKFNKKHGDDICDVMFTRFCKENT